MGSDELFPQISRSGNLCGTERIVTLNLYHRQEQPDFFYLISHLKVSNEFLIFIISRTLDRIVGARQEVTKRIRSIRNSIVSIHD